MIDLALGLEIGGLKENPQRFEAIIADQQPLAASDPAVRTLLADLYLQADREAEFDRFASSLEFATLLRVLQLLGVPRSARMCEIGGGPGFLAWALGQSGFSNLDLLEPNAHFITGSGYLRSRADVSRLTIWNDVDEWQQRAGRYDLVLTRNCVHHFPNITQVAAATRQKIESRGRWIAYHEWFADTPQEQYTMLREHPLSQRYGLYEWPYPAHHYVDAFRMAGFCLDAVIPNGYANNCLAAPVNDPGGPDNQAWTAFIDSLLRDQPSLTVNAFQEELQRNRDGALLRTYTRPQALIFGRIELAA